MISTIGDLAPDANDLDQLTAAITMLNADKDRLSRIQKITRSVLDAAGIDANLALTLADPLIRAARLIVNIDRDILKLRSKPIFDDEADTILTQAAEKQKELASTRNALERTFAMQPMPDRAEVERHIRPLQQAGAFGGLKREVREAKRFFRSVAAPNARAKSSAMARHLSRLAEYLNDVARLSDDAALATVCGQQFKGLKTDFNMLLRVHNWGYQIRAKFSASEDVESKVREFLLYGDAVLLDQVKAQLRDVDLGADPPSIQQLGPDKTLLVPELLQTVSNRIEEMDGAVSSLSEAGIRHKAPLDAVECVAVTVGALNPLRLDLLRSVPECSEEAIPISLISEALALATGLVETGLSPEDLPRVLSGDVAGFLDFLREWSTGTLRDLEREAEARGQANEFLHFTSSLFSSGSGEEDVELASLVKTVGNALSHSTELIPWATYLRAMKQATGLGVGEIAGVLAESETPPLQGVAAYSALVYRHFARAAYKKFPRLSDFDGLGIEQARAQFRDLDVEIINLQRTKIRSDLCHAHIPAGNGVGLKRDFTDLALIRNEFGKKKRHIPLRDLFARASGAIHSMKPCLLMSPMSVASYLKPGATTFDVIVIDEASQMPPEDALGALLRADNCVIVGDSQQLPPTSFFRRFEDAVDMEDDEESEDTAVESILDQASGVFTPPRHLRWHYRSRHQSLIAFSNKHFYNNSLTVFPSPIERDENFGVRLVQVNGQYGDRHNPDEAKAIASWAVDFMARRTEKSLGLVAVNQLQRDLINDEMERLFARDSAASSYRKTWQIQNDGLQEFFVKNLENVQGDERDVIAISTVYGRNADGRVMQNFGPISQRNGHRRLNVLFTRAREQVVLFSSLKPDDIQLRDTTGEGPRVLRNYLEYALTGRLDTGETSDRPPDSDFEVAVSNRLSRLGYEVVPQVGVAGFFIDLAVRHPEFPGTFLVGIECDGATYHSAKAARDRDRLREEVLVGLGWTIYRVWSTDWFSDPDGQTAKLRAFVEQTANERREILAQPVSVVADEETHGAVEGFDHDTGLEEADGAEPDGNTDGAEEPTVAVAVRPTDETASIGDKIVFHFDDDPDELRSLTIVFGAGDPGLGTVSASSPVGEALRGSSVGEDVEVHTPQGTRTAIIDDIIRPEGPTPPPREGPPLEDPPGDGPRGRAAGIELGHEDFAQSSRAAATGALRVVPYTNWPSRALPDPRNTDIAAVARHLLEIIEIEGPIRVRRAYQIYAQAAGINRVGRNVRSTLNKALHQLKGDVALESGGPDDTQVASIARTFDTPSVIVRAAGGRDFWDIPPSELAAVLNQEAAQFVGNDEGLYHRVLDRYGIRRLTTNILTELERLYRP